MTARLEDVHCNLCGANDPLVIYPGASNGAGDVDLQQFRSSGDEPLREPLVRCRVCDLVYVSPRLNSRVVLEGYERAVDETFVSQAAGREATFRRCLHVISSVWRRAPGRLLDVGTANGSFLKVARDAGWEIAGCEPSRWMCDWCQRHYGITVTQGQITDGRYSSESFDVVTLWDVLEHTADPMATLRECARVLRPGGLLVVNYPDYDSAVARLMGRKWVFLLSVHYYYFTPATIARALRQVGCSVVTRRRHLQWLELDYVLFRATPYLGAPGRWLRSIARVLRIGPRQVPYWMGQTLVVARKDRAPKEAVR